MPREKPRKLEILIPAGGRGGREGEGEGKGGGEGGVET
jgi:hypothetical protein